MAKRPAKQPAKRASKRATAKRAAPKKKPPPPKKQKKKKPPTKKPAPKQQKPAKAPKKQARTRRMPAINLLRRNTAAVDAIVGTFTFDAEMSSVVATELDAEAALEAGNTPRAIALYSRLIETLDTPLASHLVARGRAFYLAGDHEAAINDFESGLALEPHFPGLYFEKGKAELGAKRAHDADASFTRDLETDPSPMAFYNRHLARRELGDREGALADLDRAVEGLPNDLAVRTSRAVVRAANNDLEGALAETEHVLRFITDDPMLQDFCGRLALNLGRFDRAAIAYRAASRLTHEAGDPPKKEHLAGEALALGKLGRYDESIALHDKALARWPDDPTLLCNRGWTYHLAGRDADALRDLDRALAIDDSYVLALENRAEIYTALGDRNRALADYRALDALGHDVTDAIARLVAP